MITFPTNPFTSELHQSPTNSHSLAARKEGTTIWLVTNSRNWLRCDNAVTAIWGLTSVWANWVTSTFSEEAYKTNNCWHRANSTASRKVNLVITSSEKWREITPMKHPRSTGFSLIFKNKIYVFGGYTADKKRSKTIEAYDPYKNYWENLNVNSILPRSNFIVVFKPAYYSLSNLMKSYLWVEMSKAVPLNQSSESISLSKHTFGTPP